MLQPHGRVTRRPPCLIVLRYSTNEGEIWTDFQFSKREVYVYQLLTEPGEKSTIFTIFGSYADQRHSWLILQVNTSDVLGKSEQGGGCVSLMSSQQALPGFHTVNTEH